MSAHGHSTHCPWLALLLTAQHKIRRRRKNNSKIVTSCVWGVLQHHCWFKEELQTQTNHESVCFSSDRWTHSRGCHFDTNSAQHTGFASLDLLKFQNNDNCWHSCTEHTKQHQTKVSNMNDVLRRATEIWSGTPNKARAASSEDRSFCDFFMGVLMFLSMWNTLEDLMWCCLKAGFKLFTCCSHCCFWKGTVVHDRFVHMPALHVHCCPVGVAWGKWLPIASFSSFSHSDCFSVACRLHGKQRQAGQGQRLSHATQWHKLPNSMQQGDVCTPQMQVEGWFETWRLALHFDRGHCVVEWSMQVWLVVWHWHLPRHTCVWVSTKWKSQSQWWVHCHKPMPHQVPC